MSQLFSCSWLNVNRGEAAQCKWGYKIVMKVESQEGNCKDISLRNSPRCRGQTPPSSVSGWSLRPGWPSLWDTHRSGLTCAGAGGPQRRSHYKTPSQNLPLVHPSSAAPQRVCLSWNQRCEIPTAIIDDFLKRYTGSFRWLLYWFFVTYINCNTGIVANFFLLFMFMQPNEILTHSLWI